MDYWSLWQVDDEVNRKLMVKAYENWRKGKQTKLGAWLNLNANCCGKA